MKLMFIVYLMTGTLAGGLIIEARNPRAHHLLEQCLMAAMYHIPALLLTALGIWQAKKHGRFMGLDWQLFSIVAAICYGAGIGLGIYSFR
jgi:hypothetical protein